METEEKIYESVNLTEEEKITENNLTRSSSTLELLKTFNELTKQRSTESEISILLFSKLCILAWENGISELEDTELN